jgi:hypothetical protein
MKSLNNQKVNMKRKIWFAPIFVMILCLLTSGCFSIEQEIFLEPDGSGDLVVHFSMPNFPESLKKDVPPSQQDPEKMIDAIKQKFANELPPTIKLKDLKQSQRNGAIALYVVLHFNQLNDVNSLLDKFAKEVLSQTGPSPSPDYKDKSLWKVQLEKAGDLTVITQSVYSDIMGAMEEARKLDKLSSAPAASAPAAPVESEAVGTPKSAPKPAGGMNTGQTARGAKPAAPKEENPFENMADFMKNSEELLGILSSMYKMRYVIHAPKKISETNADIVLNGNIAVWNASPSAFIKEKKPLEMKVTY